MNFYTTRWKCTRCGVENEPDSAHCYLCDHTPRVLTFSDAMLEFLAPLVARATDQYADQVVQYAPGPDESERERIRGRAQILAFREVHEYARTTLGMVMTGNAVDELYRRFKEREAELVDSLTAQYIIEKGL